MCFRAYDCSAVSSSSQDRWIKNKTVFSCNVVFHDTGHFFTEYRAYRKKQLIMTGLKNMLL